MGNYQNNVTWESWVMDFVDSYNEEVLEEDEEN